MKKLRVALLFGGKSAEHEISIMSARSVLDAADKNKYEFIPIAINKDGYWLTPAASREVINQDNCQQVPLDKTDQLSQSLIPFLEQKFDLVFPLLHGPNGEDGKIQGFLDLINLPYVGSGVLGSAAGMDKIFMKQIFSYHSLPQGDYLSLTNYQFKQKNIDDIHSEIKTSVGYPCFVKPANMGSSIGITRIMNKNELEKALIEAFKYDNKVVLEETIVGREIECSVLGNVNVDASLPGEIVVANEFYDYDAKYRDQDTELIIPAPLSNKIINKIQELAIKAFKVINGRGFARIDFFITNEGEQILINEINTIPGFTRYSMYPKLWEVSGVDYPELIDRLIQLALEE